MPAKPASIKLELASAYGATLTRILSWVVVSGLIYRAHGDAPFAIFALLRTTIGLLGYCSFGVLPAMIRLAAKINRVTPPLAIAIEQPTTPVLSYSEPDTHWSRELSPIQTLFHSGCIVSLLTGFVGTILLIVYATNFNRIHSLPGYPSADDIENLAVGLGVGLLLRLVSDSMSGILQSLGRITLDNSLFIASELLWVVFTFGLSNHSNIEPSPFLQAGPAYMASGLMLLGARYIIVRSLLAFPVNGRFASDFRQIAMLLGSGLAITVAQLADFLYAPTDNILINKLIDPLTVGVYAPAIQIDAGLLMLMTGVAAVVLPRAAIAHANDEREKVRQYYVRGTLLSTGVLVVTALVVWAVAPWIFRLWLNDPMIATQAILPLVLIHTVVGGSSAVGRSILLGMGKVRAFTIAVLVAGTCNVLLSFSFVYFFHLGLKGIIYGTILAVVGRCAVWMPWYVRRCLRRA